MAVSLEEALTNFRESLDLFEKNWKADHAADPESFPMTLPDDNSGLWENFMVEFHLTRE